MESESRNPIQYYVMDEEQIKKICETSSKAAIASYKAEMKKDRKHYYDRRRHNTDLLLRNYKMFRLSMENAICSLQALEEDMETEGILNLMMEDDSALQSIRNSKGKTIALVKHIDRMTEIYRIFCERSTDPLDIRRYNMLYDRYLAEENLTVSEIAEKYIVSKESVYGDLRIAKERLSALLFGADAL